MNISADLFIGLTWEDAKQWAVDHKVPIRVSRKDGVSFILTRDFKPERINVHLVDNIVTKATHG